ncbi:MAG: PIG-L family deacetylase [Patescibacteria group bacterium]|nr:PIG-L family deacetylase [Patescibacteria group bacterium]
MKFLFVFAHPDDETFSSGGTIAKLTAAKHKVKLITATKGEAGEPGNPPITTREKIGEVREQELRRAAKILGISDIFFLGFIDGKVRYARNKKLEGKILSIFKKEKPDVIITFDKTGGSNHPDHKAIGKATTNVFFDYKGLVDKHVRLYHTAMPRSFVKEFEKQGLGYNAFGKVRGVADKNITTLVDIEKTLNTKIKALKEHKTQHQDWERFLKRMGKIKFQYEFFKLVDENKLA